MQLFVVPRTWFVCKEMPSTLRGRAVTWTLWQWSWKLPVKILSLECDDFPPLKSRLVDRLTNSFKREEFKLTPGLLQLLLAFNYTPILRGNDWLKPSNIQTQQKWRRCVQFFYPECKAPRKCTKVSCELYNSIFVLKRLCKYNKPIIK